MHPGDGALHLQMLRSAMGVPPQPDGGARLMLGGAMSVPPLDGSVPGGTATLPMLRDASHGDQESLPMLALSSGGGGPGLEMLGTQAGLATVASSASIGASGLPGGAPRLVMQANRPMASRPSATRLMCTRPPCEEVGSVMPRHRSTT